MIKKGRWKSGQSAVELTIILSISMIVLGAILSLFFQTQNSFSGTIEARKARAAIDSIADAAEMVYQQGEGSSTKVIIIVPNAVNHFNLTGKTLIINMLSGGKPRDVFRTLPFTINGTIPNTQGNFEVIIESKGDYVSIGDIDAPIITATSPSGTIGDKTPELSATTDESSTCRYDTADTDYDSMSNAFAGTSTTHTATVGPLGDSSHTYYARCKDSDGNVMTTSSSITFTIDTAPPTISFIAPTPSNLAIVSTNYIFVNTSVTPTGDSANLEWNNVNESMDGSGTNFYKNKTNLLNGDYTFRSYASDSLNWNSTEQRTVTVNDTTSPANVSSLANNSAGITFIYWTWTNPTEDDFNHTEVWLNGTFKANVSAPDNFYNATNLFNYTLYELQTKTVDHNGNINDFWTNDTAATLPIKISTLVLPQTCVAEDNAAKGTFGGSCDGTYPAVCGAGNDLLTCNDAQSETHTADKVGPTSNYGGVRITSFNSTKTDCEKIDTVKVCFEWWRSGTLQDCAISVDANGGSSYTIINSTCPSTTANNGVSCKTVTASESWTCNSFFTPSGTRALIKSEAQNSAAATITITWDVLFYNVTYIST
jgi:hypothetical protein